MRLAVQDLTISRGDLVLAEELSFAVESAGALVVLGENGSGKSTLLRTLAGLHAPDRGDVFFAIEGERAPIPEHAHYLGHSNAMKSDLSVRENLTFWSSMLGEGEREGEALLEEAAEALGIAPLLDLPHGYLSAGQRRRAALARLWVAPRPLWLLDEPTAALDRRSEIIVRDMIEAHRVEGGMVVAATHAPLNLADAARLVMGGG